MGKCRADAELLAARERLPDGDIFDHPAGAGRHHNHPLREEYRFMDRMGDEHHRQVLLLPETQQIAIELIARNFIQRAEGFIHQQQFWPRHQTTGDGDAHLHAAGEFARQDVGELAQPHQLKGFAHPGVGFCSWDAGKIQGQPDVAMDAAPGHQRGFLEDEREGKLGFFPAVATPQHQLTVAGFHQTGDHLQQGALPAAGGTEQGHKLALIDGQIDGQQRPGAVAVNFFRREYFDGRRRGRLGEATVAHDGEFRGGIHGMTPASLTISRV